MLYSVNKVLILSVLLPAVLLQYGLTIFCLLKLLFLSLPRAEFAIWNFFILLALGIGVIVFLICYYFFRRTVFKSAGIFKESHGENAYNETKTKE